MVAITINRYVLIGHNHLYSKIYRFPCIVAMAIAVWIFSFAMMLPPLLEVWGRLGLDERTFSCTILKKNGKSPKKMLFAVGVLLPCLIIVTCYALIFVKVRRSRQTIRGHSMHGARTSMSPSKQSEQQKNNARKEDMRLTKMMLTIFLAFLACFFPLMLVNVFDDDDVRYPSLHVVASVLAWMSAVINPFIYAFSNRQYRSAYRRLLCGSPRPPSFAQRRLALGQQPYLHHGRVPVQRHLGPHCAQEPAARRQVNRRRGHGVSAGSEFRAHAARARLVQSCRGAAAAPDCDRGGDAAAPAAQAPLSACLAIVSYGAALRGGKQRSRRCCELGGARRVVWERRGRSAEGAVYMI
ncbi:protein trapped in endoderm-1-like [Pollicipes pollicipes]|uniref:protein trapped in endoderm-1-like n=1 Tax=Pollicipes pollicipes TaxID=41117 RepID=UPI001884B1C9|nr:protein trapped in endoderm-1-like [Pollicipes pollicipes]